MGFLAVAGAVLGLDTWMVVVYAINAVVHLGLARLVAARLIVSDEEVVLRSMLRTRVVPWGQVQRIAVDWRDAKQLRGPLLRLARDGGEVIEARAFTLRLDRDLRDGLHTDLERAAVIHDVELEVEDPSWSSR